MRVVSVGRLVGIVFDSAASIMASPAANFDQATTILRALFRGSRVALHDDAPLVRVKIPPTSRGDGGRDAGARRQQHRTR
mmetsp:Transcript_37296/g.100952  ORF Transcript_37296/g.100952 Transcript_37296/m.100952 type:complete len:80 (+) Transcript_37296:1649-1888(+)